MSERGTVFPSTALAAPADRRLALAVITVSLAAFFVSVPFAQHPLLRIWAFIPMYDSAISLSDLMTASLLFMQFKILRTPSLLAIGCGYFFTGLMVIPHALTFPGLFSEPGLLGAGPHTTAWLYVFWHGGFPIAVLAYAFLKNREDAAPEEHPALGHALLLAIGLVLIVVLLLTVLATVGKSSLPGLMAGNRAASGLFTALAALLALTATALLLLWLSGIRSVLDLWLTVVLCTWLINIALGAFLNGGRFDFGFYAGRVYGFVAANFVLLVLLRQTGILYARLAALFEAERRGHRRETEKRRHVEATLARQEDRERLLIAAVQSTEDAIVTKALDGTITAWNPAAERLFGYTAGEIVGRNIETIVPEDHRAELHGILARLARGERIERHETVRQTKAGRRIDVALSVSPIKSPSGAIIGACKIARDVTAQKRVERMKDEFIATVSHELRTPITNIAGPLGLLAGGAAGEMPERMRRLVTMAQKNSVRLTHLVNDILDIGRIESGQMPFHKNEIRLRRLVERAIEANRPLVEQFGVTVRLDEGADAVVDTDPEQFMQALAKLLSNAVKFSPRGEEVVVSIERTRDRAKVSVRDHGPGIPEELKDAIFEKFTQVEPVNARQNGGNGLGLSIARQIMARLGGQIGHEPAPAGGTIFHVCLPFLPDEKYAPASAAAAARQWSPSNP
jgi:PAS domain S-box-containing protein